MGSRLYRLKIMHPAPLVEETLQQYCQGTLGSLSLARRTAEAIDLLFPGGKVELVSIQHVPFYAEIPVTWRGK